MTDSNPAHEKNTPPPDESVWSYRGYHLRSSKFTTAMVHFYRAEIQRSNTWRMRLDNTTNWAVITIGLFFNGLLTLAGVLTAGLTQTSGEVLPKFGDVPVLNALWRAMGTNRRGEESAPSQKSGQASRRHRTIRALVVTDNPQAVSKRIIQEMKRSGTLLRGQGIYAQTDREYCWWR